MKNWSRTVLFISGLVLLLPTTHKVTGTDTVMIDINLDVKHSVGKVSTFDRKKFITIHSDITEQEWEGDNFTANLRNDFLNGYDVYLGRNTGGITWWLNSMITEDKNRFGFADSASITTNGANVKSDYASKPQYRSYEFRNDQVICAQLHPFWPDGQETKLGWSLSQTDTQEEPFGTATGEYMGRFIRDFFGTGGATGQPRPNLVEVINEPLWHLVDYGEEEPEKVFRFHNAVADQIRKYNDNLFIGGYCTAFPDLDKNNFQQWEERWKLFMDISGEYMDFWTIHLYDFPSINNGRQLYRKGSNMEATFDMLEQYSYLSFGVVKPFMISEFGAQMHDYWGAWSPYRDWLHMKSVNSMLMQFMERAHIINKTINFIPLKAEWGTGGVNDTYNHRLMRKENEPDAYTGQWVYSDMVKTYQLWSDVKGTRVDSRPSNVDVMSDVYVNGDVAYVIVNNLEFHPFEIKINAGLEGMNVQSVQIKQLYLKDNVPQLDDYTLTGSPSSITLEAEGTLILAYTFAENVSIKENSSEVKYYADTYYKSIVSNAAETFEINAIVPAIYGESTLRIGVGRNHGKNLTPQVSFNGYDLEVPENYRGDKQEDRNNFFGVLEIPVPYEYLQSENTVSVQFSDDGGTISSVALQVFNFTRKIDRSTPIFTSVGEIKSPATFKIFPNPCAGNFIVSVQESKPGTSLSVYSLRGKKLITREITGLEQSKNINGLMAGIYFVRIESENNSYTQKLIVY